MADTTERAAHPRPVVHIGLHKTGSTWLQRHVFSRMDLGFAVIPCNRKVVHDLALSDPFRYQQSATAQLLDLQVVSTARRGLRPVLTHERLSGAVESGHADAQLIADRIIALDPAAVIVGVREQRRLAASAYGQYIRDGGVMTLRQFLTTPRRGVGLAHLFNWRSLEFDVLIKYYIDRLGPERVTVVPLEMLAEGEARVLRSLAQWSSSPGLRSDPPTPARSENVALTNAQLALERLGNRLVRSSLNPAGRLDGRVFGPVLDRAVRMAAPPASAMRRSGRSTAQIEELLPDAQRLRFAESNRRLRALTGLHFERWGYLGL